MRSLAILLALLAPASYRQEIEAWRAQREAALKADGGWLTVAGLFWLKEGGNPAGSADTNRVVLPRGPAQFGVFELHGAGVTFRASDGRVTPMRPDTAGSPTIVSSGDLTMFVIQRGSRLGIRLKDNKSELRSHFKGLRWFPVNERYRIEAKFVPYNPPKMIAVPDVLGDTSQSPCPGYVAFTLGGKEYRLEPMSEGRSLFFVFKDLTSGKETYPSGRFLYTPAPKDGKVVLDFNRAENPPCAFTPYATCPLPPKQNRLAVRIEAGEMGPPGH